MQMLMLGLLFLRNVCFNVFTEKDEWQISSDTCEFENDTEVNDIASGTTTIKVRTWDKTHWKWWFAILLYEIFQYLI